MLPEGDPVAHAGEVEVRAVEDAGPEVVVLVVVIANQLLRAIGSSKTHERNCSLDELLFLLRFERLLLVDLPPVRVARNRIVDDGDFIVEGQIESATNHMGKRGAVVRCVRD